MNATRDTPPLAGNSVGGGICVVTATPPGARAARQDHALQGDGSLAALLEMAVKARCEVVIDADEAACAQALGRKPDMVLLDLERLNGDQAAEALRSRWAERAGAHPLAVINAPRHDPGHGQPSTEALALALGARGIIYADQPPETLIKAVKAMLRGELWFSRAALSRKLVLQRQQLAQAARQTGAQDNRAAAVSPDDLAILTPREREILALLAEGAPNETIAEGLGVALSTVKTHVYHIYEKLHVPNRVAATRWWTARNGRRG